MSQKRRDCSYPLHLTCHLLNDPVEGIEVSETQEQIYHAVFLGLALVIVPLCFAGLCAFMLYRRTHWYSYPAYFFLFGTIGGWCLTFGLSPSPFAAAGSIFMVLTLPVCLIYSLFLQFRKNRNRFDSVAMVGGYSYTALLAVGVISLILVGSY